uniref:MPN domain-containing protein n=1 Tax=Phaeomonas parva TaxID=124430 RepID=A0A7S1UK57_9STRA|mmetsp:Transcript_9311/g.27348  ORF Transcript_9311/g.27348 Transcript_9311/m.27348 type:complete len:341 (+) Transcript_9311:204-1226(+)
MAATATGTATAPAAPAASASQEMEVVVHPLVLLSAVDHYNRLAKEARRGANKRVVGVLLGTRQRGLVDITNSYGVPFEEDKEDTSVWYLDHNFLENMHTMFKKINAKERIQGFYSTGPLIRENDLGLDELFRRYCPEPVFVIIDVRPGVSGIPTKAYVSQQDVEQDGKEMSRTFRHIPSTIGAQEAEEVGVEHLLRDINDPSVSTLAHQVKQKVTALEGLTQRLEEMKAYLENVIAGRMPMNNQIVYNLQTIFNLLPNLNIEHMVRAMMVKTNDLHLIMYITSLIRSIIALHDLLNNKVRFRSGEAGVSGEEKKEDEEKKEEGKEESKDANEGDVESKEK